MDLSLLSRIIFKQWQKQKPESQAPERLPSWRLDTKRIPWPRIIALTTQQTATGTSRHALQLPSDDIHETKVNISVQDIAFEHSRYRIGELIRRERHSDVYSVYFEYDDGDPILDSGAELRVFVLDGVPGKLRQHRKRCIERLEPRTYLKATCRGATVIGYTINEPAKEHDKRPLGKDKDSNSLWRN